MNEEIRIPPHNPEAEKSVLGCLMLDSSKIAAVASGLKAEDFYGLGNQRVYRAILALDAAGIEVDVITVADKLEANGHLEDIGGESGLMAIFSSVPRGAHAVHHAEIVLHDSRRRRAIALAKKLADGAYDQAVDSAALFDSTIQFANRLADIAAESEKQKVTTLADQVAKAIERSSEGVSPALYITIPDADRATRGLAFGELVVVGGRPSHGKSMYALQCLDEASAKGYPGLIVSEEMTSEMIGDRALSFVTVLSRDERYGQLRRLQYDHNEHFKDRAPVLIAEKCHHISAVEREVARAVRTHGIKICAVDYAQLLKGSGASRYEQVSDVSMRCKSMATKHGIIVFLLAQLGREMEKRSPPEPRMMDLKESGQIEQDGDVVLFPYWPFALDKTYEDPGEYRLYVAKNRSRGISEPVVLMRFNPARQRLYSVEQEGPHIPGNF